MPDDQLRKIKDFVRSIDNRIALTIPAKNRSIKFTISASRLNEYCNLQWDEFSAIIDYLNGPVSGLSIRSISSLGSSWGEYQYEILINNPKLYAFFKENIVASGLVNRVGDHIDEIECGIFHESEQVLWKYVGSNDLNIDKDGKNFKLLGKAYKFPLNSKNPQLIIGGLLERECCSVRPQDKIAKAKDCDKKYYDQFITSMSSTTSLGKKELLLLFLFDGIAKTISFSKKNAKRLMGT